MTDLDLQINKLFDEICPHITKLKNNLTSQMTSGQLTARFKDVNEFIVSNGFHCQQIDQAGLVVDIEGYTNKSNIVALCVEKSEFFNSCDFDDHLNLKFSNSGYDYGLILKFVIGLGAAKILSELQKELNGTIRIFFLTDEDNKLKKSDYLIQQNVLKQISVMYGMTFNPSIPNGCVGVKFGPLMASNDFFTVKINNDKQLKTTNLNFSNIIPIAAHVISALQTMTTRKIDPLSPVVLSILSIHSEGDNSRIPDRVLIEGSYKTIEETVRKQIPGIMDNTIRGIIDACGANFNFDSRNVSPVICADQTATHTLMNAAKEILGEDYVHKMEYPTLNLNSSKSMLNMAPGTVLHLGINKGSRISNRANLNRSDIEDMTIAAGVKVLSLALYNHLMSKI